MAKKKGLIEKAVDVIDHMIHTDHIVDEEYNAAVSMDEEIGKGLTPKKSSEKDYAQHPKFAKFNSQGSEKNGYK